MRPSLSGILRIAMKLPSRSVAAVLIAASLSAAQAHAETIDGSIKVDGVDRTWRLFVPESYQASAQHPLVLDFHGSGGSPQGQSRTSGFTRLASDKGFLVVNPAGKYVRVASSGSSWNVDLDSNGVDDVRFARELIAHLEQLYAIDPRRIYATGFSGGARMSSRLACDLSDVIAAVGPVGGIRFPDKCTPDRPVPVMAVHAEDDEVNHFEHRGDSPAYWPVGVNEAISSWAKFNECAAAPREQPLSANAVKFAYENSKAAGDVILVKLEKGGHTWPGSTAAKDATVNIFPATQQLWEFFEQHPRR
jgi:polyhydroxybutyrate depolymerase